ncbi:hypothetical protein CYMTET_32474, partial [Cymbomonas tetramitiformis]
MGVGASSVLSHDSTSYPSKDELQHWASLLSTELADNVIPFWLEHSIDQINGGFYNCLGRNGERYSTEKHVWLQGRQVYMMAKLSNEQNNGSCPWSQYGSRLFVAAQIGSNFLRKHIQGQDGEYYFCLAEDGRPCRRQRKIFSAAFYCMGLSELALACRERKQDAEALELQGQALEVFEDILAAAANPSKIGVPEALPGAPNLVPLNAPMILLNIIVELRQSTGS